MAFDPDDYRAPQCKITVDGNELSSGSYYIEQVNVQLSVTPKANSADVTIVANYEYKNSCIGGGLLSTLGAGSIVTIEMGYSQTSVVFMGYINTVSASFSESGVFVSFSCLDARGLLMGNSSWKAHENESVSQIITDLLDSLKDYVGKITVDITGEVDQEYPLPQNNLDDYQYICRLAKLTNSIFYMTASEIKFVENELSSVSSSYSYTWGQDLISFERTVDLSDQIGSVTVMSNMPDTAEEFSATADPPDGDGQTADDLNSDIGGKQLVVNCYTIKDPDEAQAYADAMMFEMALNICSGSATVLGNQKLTPGEGVSFDGLDPEINGDYLITSVSHSFSSGGFLSTIGFNRTTA